MKEEIRLLGIDDSPFDKFKDKQTLAIGSFFRGGSFMDGVMSTAVSVDGDDSTDKIAEMVKKSRFYSQLKAIMLDGIAVGGFNIVDINELFEKTKIPVIVVMRDYPELDEMKKALAKLKKEEKIALLEKAGEIHKVEKIHIQIAGINLEEAKEIIRISCTHSYIPEPIRVAHLIAAGITKGESRGKA